MNINLCAPFRRHHLHFFMLLNSFLADAVTLFAFQPDFYLPLTDAKRKLCSQTCLRKNSLFSCQQRHLVIFLFSAQFSRCRTENYSRSTRNIKTISINTIRFPSPGRAIVLSHREIRKMLNNNFSCESRT